MEHQTKKKILYVITKSNWGGAQRYVFDLATHLDKDKFEVSVALGGSGILSTKLEESGIRTIKIKNLERNVSIFKEFNVFSQLIQLYRRERPDIIHLNSSKIGGLGSLAGRLHNFFIRIMRHTSPATIIFTAHGWAFNENRGWLSKFVIELIYVIMIILCHKTIAVSDGLVRQISQWPFVKNKIIVIKNSIYPIDFYPKEKSRSEIFEKITNKISSDKNAILNRLWIGTIGELHHIKGQKYLIESLKDFKLTNPDFVMIIIGEGEEKDSLERQIKEEGLAEQVFLVGFIEDTSKYLQAFDMFVLPSLSESLGYAVLEAGLAGLPVIASAVGGIPEIITTMKNGILVKPKNIREMTEALKYLADNSVNIQERRSEMGKNLKHFVSENFSPKNMLEQTYSQY